MEEGMAREHPTSSKQQENYISHTHTSVALPSRFHVHGGEKNACDRRVRVIGEVCKERQLQAGG